MAVRRALNGGERFFVLMELQIRFLQPFWRGGFVMLQEPADAGFSDAVLPGGLDDAHAALPIAEHRFPIHFERWAAEPAAFHAGSAHPGPHALDYEIPFQLGDRAEYDGDRFTERLGRIDGFAEGDQFHTALTQRVQVVLSTWLGPF